MSVITLNTLDNMKQSGEKFTMLTVYDASFAQLLAEAGVDVLFVGDSLGNVVQGRDSTIPVSVGDIVYHTQCVARASGDALLMADMPFMSYATVEQAMNNASQLMQAGAHIVKMEGGQWTCESVSALTERGIPVCAHLGLTPQSVHMLGGYKVQGKQQAQAEQIMTDALALQAAGARLLVLECVPTSLAADITAQLSIPTIGIGAGTGCDAQVLVLHDLLGMGSGKRPRFVRDFLSGQSDGISGAVSSFIHAVKDGSFPSDDEVYR